MVIKETFGPQFSFYKKGDLHAHSGYSQGGITWDGRLQPEQIVDRAEERGDDFLAITDHDTIEPSLVAKNYAVKHGYHIEIVIGKEVSTNGGHILALNMQSNIPFSMSKEETIRSIHCQGGFAIAAHPFYTLTSSVGGKGLTEIASNPDPEIYWDGIEVFNAGANDFRYIEWFRHFTDSNRKARRFYAKEGLTGLYGIPIGASDSHSEGAGRTVTVIPDGITIYEAFRTQQVGVQIRDGKEGYTLAKLKEIDRKAKGLQHARETIAGETHIFPIFVASSVES